MDIRVLRASQRVNKCLLGHAKFCVDLHISHEHDTRARKASIGGSGGSCELRAIEHILLTCACKYILGQLRYGQSIGA